MSRLPALIFVLTLAATVTLLTRTEPQGWSATSLDPGTRVPSVNPFLSMSRDDLTRGPAPAVGSTPDFRQLPQRQARNDDDDKIEITTIEPDPDPSQTPDAQATASAQPATETESSGVGETGIL